MFQALNLEVSEACHGLRWRSVRRVTGSGGDQRGASRVQVLVVSEASHGFRYSRSVRRVTGSGGGQ